MNRSHAVGSLCGFALASQFPVTGSGKAFKYTLPAAAEGKWLLRELFHAFKGMLQSSISHISP